MTESGSADIKLAERLERAADHLDKQAKAMWDARSRDFANDCRLAAERLKALGATTTKPTTDRHVERKEMRNSGD
jgi:hypothetical protein